MVRKATTKDERASSTSAGASSRMAAQLVLAMAMAGTIMGIEHFSQFNMKYMGALVGDVTEAYFNDGLEAGEMDNSINRSCHTPTTTSVPIVIREYPNRTDLIYYVPARGHRDRSGAAIGDMLLAQAYAFRMGVPFGGACGETPHRQKNEEMIQVLGLDPILQYNCPPSAGAEHSATIIKHEIITRDTFFHLPKELLWNDEWIEYIHTQVQPQSKRWMQEGLGQANTTSTTTGTSMLANNSKNNDNYTIVAHVRRGDVDPCGHWSFRYLPNSHYLGMIDQYSKGAPPGRPVQCIVFSESKSFESFDDFEKRGCQVVLDGDPTEAWKAMLDADVLVMSLSSFSGVPAMLNPHGTIAYTPNLGPPFRKHWNWHIYKNTNRGWRNLIDLCDKK